MKTNLFRIVGVMMLAGVLLVGVPVIQAQTTMTMPTLYDQSGDPVNTSSGTALSAGWYYLQSNATGQIYYYGNGTYYDPATRTYSGSISNPNGTAGVVVSTGTVVTPGAPNTGLGTDSTLLYSLIFLSIAGLLVLGFAYPRTQVNA